jgi:Ca2+-binding RTX toxin-like protein
MARLQKLYNKDFLVAKAVANEQCEIIFQGGIVIDPDTFDNFYPFPGSEPTQTFYLTVDDEVFYAYSDKFTGNTSIQIIKDPSDIASHYRYKPVSFSGIPAQVHDQLALEIVVASNNAQGFKRINTYWDVKWVPEDLTISLSEFNENISATSTVATLSTVDRDHGEVHAYSLVNGIGDTDNAAFTVKSNQLKINASPDYETKSSYSIRVRTTDTGGLTFDKALTLTVNDLSEMTVVALSLSPASVTEDGSSNLVYTFTRTTPTTNALTVDYTIGGTATNGTDYATIPAAVTFAAGASTATVIIDPTADTTVEDDETVALTLTSGTSYTIGNTGAVTGTITNDAVALPAITLAVSPASVTEDGTGNLVYTFTRSGATTNPLTVNYTVGGRSRLVGTSKDYADYTGISTSETTKTVTFSAGSTTAQVVVDPTADTRVESNETVVLTVASGTGYTVGTTGAVTGTITNDDVQSSTSTSLTGSESSLTLTGTNAINGTGNGLDNHLTGNSANNILDGSAGNDAISGGGGNDSLIGGTGKDTMTGGTGGDQFYYRLIAESGTGSTNRDVITDFSGSNGDRIDLSAVDAFSGRTGNQAFAYIGSNLFTGTRGEARFASSLLQLNTGRDKAADMQIELKGVTTFSADFLVL